MCLHAQDARGLTDRLCRLARHLSGARFAGLWSGPVAGLLEPQAASGPWPALPRAGPVHGEALVVAADGDTAWHALVLIAHPDRPEPANWPVARDDLAAILDALAGLVLPGPAGPGRPDATPAGLPALRLAPPPGRDAAGPRSGGWARAGFVSVALGRERGRARPSSVRAETAPAAAVMRLRPIPAEHGSRRNADPEPGAIGTLPALADPAGGPVGPASATAGVHTPTSAPASTPPGAPAQPRGPRAAGAGRSVPTLGPRPARAGPGAVRGAANAMDADSARALSEALARGQIDVRYQAYFDLGAGRAAGYEALMRWNRPGHGLVPPDAFIPLAEAHGLIQGLGQWVIETACRAATTWPAALAVSVNVSALQFARPCLADQVARALATTGLAPGRLELEVTESILLDAEGARDTLAAIRALGVQIAIDDFGSGYASFGYLGRFPFTRLKLDRSLIQTLDDPVTVEIARAIMRIARMHGATVTAEGIETPDQLARVKALGFSHGQGFMLARPVTADEARDSGLAGCLLRG